MNPLLVALIIYFTIGATVFFVVLGALLYSGRYRVEPSLKAAVLFMVALLVTAVLWPFEITFFAGVSWATSEPGKDG